MSKSANWILLLMPYGEGATSMSGVLGYRAADAPGDGAAMLNEIMGQAADLGLDLDLGAAAEVLTLRVDGCGTIAETIDGVVAAAGEQGVEVGAGVTLVNPQDNRHGLAHAVLDEAGKRGFEFSRHIPGGDWPTHGVDPTPEPKMEAEAAAVLINDLLGRTVQAAQMSQFGDALTTLHQAIGQGVSQYGWAHHYTGYSLRMLAQVAKAFGLPAYHGEAVIKMRRMWHVLEPAGETPNADLVKCLHAIAEEADGLDGGLAARFRALAGG